MLALPLAYFHGMPGGPGEWAVNAPETLHGEVWLADRNDPAVTPEPIAGQLAQAYPQGVTLIGFSAGAFAGLQVALNLGESVRHLHLISPAAPLQLGSFHAEMAGGPVFLLASQRPGLFRLLVSAERLLARHVPRFLLGRLMASAQGGDAALARDPAFLSGMAQVLRDGLGRDPRGFEAEVLAYVHDWRGDLARLNVPVTIWQGDADNWTPPAMGQALHAALPGSRLEWLPRCSHYSALQAALRKLA